MSSLKSPQSPFEWTEAENSFTAAKTAVADATLLSIRFLCFLARNEKDIKNRVRACENVSEAKVLKHTKALLSTFALPDARYAHIHIDFIGPIHHPKDINIVLPS
ncbi:hypothetical protein TNCV_721931 [Trichonephila clavipes]|nr:hypothetical protein TNCV_721931 [Trichonephila clavipes]